jgi:plasmid stabilization system protein ParE
MPRLRLHFAASIGEASVHAAVGGECVAIADYLRERNPAVSGRVRAAIYASLQDLLLFPNAGRRQQTEGVRKFVTPKYGYLVC